MTLKEFTTVADFKTISPKNSSGFGNYFGVVYTFKDLTMMKGSYPSSGGGIFRIEYFKKENNNGKWRQIPYSYFITLLNQRTII